MGSVLPLGVPARVGVVGVEPLELVGAGEELALAVVPVPGAASLLEGQSVTGGEHLTRRPRRSRRNDPAVGVGRDTTRVRIVLVGGVVQRDPAAPAPGAPAEDLVIRDIAERGEGTCA